MENIESFGIEYKSNRNWFYLTYIKETCPWITHQPQLFRELFRYMSINEFKAYLLYILPKDEYSQLLSDWVKSDKEYPNTSHLKQVIQKSRMKIDKINEDHLNKKNLEIAFLNLIKKRLDSQFFNKSCQFLEKYYKNKIIHKVSKTIIQKSLQLYFDIAEDETKGRNRHFDKENIPRIINSLDREDILKILNNNIIISEYQGRYSLDIKVKDYKGKMDTLLGEELYRIYLEKELRSRLLKEDRQEKMRQRRRQERQDQYDMEDFDKDILNQYPISQNGFQCITKCYKNHPRIQGHSLRTDSSCACTTDTYQSNWRNYDWDWCNEHNCAI